MSDCNKSESGSVSGGEDTAFVRCPLERGQCPVNVRLMSGLLSFCYAQEDTDTDLDSDSNVYYIRIKILGMPNHRLRHRQVR
jgi:hypothetical protein